MLTHGTGDVLNFSSEEEAEVMQGIFALIGQGVKDEANAYETERDQLEKAKDDA
jgi:hypothetical protein